MHQAIARTLGTAILSGRYQPGESLEGGIEQALALGVSRTPYREAIRIFVAKGLPDSRPRAGTHVTPRAHHTHCAGCHGCLRNGRSLPWLRPTVGFE